MPEIGPTPEDRAAATQAVYLFLRALTTLPHPRILEDTDGRLQIVVERHVITFKILSVEPVDNDEAPRKIKGTI